MLVNDKSVVFFDGKFLKTTELPTVIFSQSLHYGNAAVEGMRAYETSAGCRIFKASEHFNRFLFSAERLGLSVGQTAEQLEQAAYRLLEENNLTNAYIRPLLLAGDSMSLFPLQKSHLIMTAFKWAKYHKDKKLNIKISSFRRPNPQAYPPEVKMTGTYVNSYMATAEAVREGYDDAVLCDSEGFAAQGSVMNLFIEKDGILYTPPKGNIMPGITRRTLIELAEKEGLKVKEKRITTEELMSADAAFFCGTAAEITEIASINGQALKFGQKEAVYGQLAEAYRELIRTPYAASYTII